MAKFLPIVQVQKELRQLLQESKLADYFERLCQTDSNTLNILLRAAENEPDTWLIVSKPEDLPPDMFQRKAGFAIAGEVSPNGANLLVTPAAILALVRESQVIRAKAEELLNWLKEKKLDQ